MTADPGAGFPQRVALYFGAVFLIYGVHVTYFPVWLAWRGLTPEEIGLMTAVPILLRSVLTPLIAAHADATGRHREIVISLSISTVVSVGAVWASPNFWFLLFTVVPFVVAMVTVLPLVDTIAVSGVTAAGHDYGRMRLWGSLTFLVATLTAGAMFDAFGAPAIIWALAGAAVATAAASLVLPKSSPAATALAAARTPEPRIVRKLLTSPTFWLFMLAVGAAQASHAAFYTFGALHLQKQGVSGTAFGTLWVVAILAETALFAWSSGFVTRLGPVNLLLIGSLAGVLRWAVMGLDPPYAVIVVMQVLHAATFGATHLGAIHFIARAVPAGGAGTAQALYSAIGTGLTTACATVIAGQVYPLFAGQTYFLMSVIACFGLAAALTLARVVDRKPIS